MGTIRGWLKHRQYEMRLDTCTMEVMACRDALALAKQHSDRRLMLEIDCLDLVNLWKKKQAQHQSVVDPILREIVES